MKISQIKTFVTLAAVILLLGACASSQTKSAASAGFISTKGQQFIAPDGSEYHITGINLGNWINPEGYMFLFKKTSSASEINRAFCQMVGEEYVASFWKRFIENYVTEQDIAFIASTGVNSIRLPFHYKLFTDEYYMGSNDPARGYAIVDMLVEWCAKHDLRIILDMHCAPGGQTGDNIDDSYAYPWLMTDKTQQDKFVKVWCDIAKYYASEPTIIGYDLLNEPIATHYNDEKEMLNAQLEPLYIRVVKAMREWDKNHIMFLGGAQWNTNFDVFTDWTFDDKLAYTCHSYWSPTVQATIQNYLDFRSKSNKPMYLGESGENTDEWVYEFRKLLDTHNIGWHFWPYKKLEKTSSYMHIAVPDGWEQIVEFVEGDRSSYDAIRKLRGNQAQLRSILDNFLELSKFSNCVENPGFIEALTKE